MRAEQNYNADDEVCGICTFPYGSHRAFLEKGNPLTLEFKSTGRYRVFDPAPDKRPRAHVTHREVLQAIKDYLEKRDGKSIESVSWYHDMDDKINYFGYIKE